MHALVLRAAVARVQRGELHRDAGAGIDAAPRARGTDGMDRLLVGAQVLHGVGRGHRRLAQHVVGEPIAARLPLHGALERLVDRLAGDELLAQHPHREVDAGADHRLTTLGDQACQGRAQALLAGGADQLAGDHQAPGRGVDEQGGAAAEMRAPIALAELVADQAVGGRPVGDAQAAPRPGTSARCPRGSKARTPASARRPQTSPSAAHAPR